MIRSSPYDLLVVGGGAAGFFGALNVALRNSSLKILILEKSPKLLSKVRISGGGRCNVTHHCFEPTPLSKHYPRGQKELKKLFREFQAKDTVAWFEQHGVKLKTEGDGRMFPITDQSETIIQTFLALADQFQIEIRTSCGVESMEKAPDHYIVHTTHGELNARKVLIAIGGHPQKEAYRWIEALGHLIVRPIPSLFTFNDSQKEFNDLMGVSVPQATVKIAGTKFLETGPVLITHWGLSGPAVIKLSAWAAEYLFEKNYTFTALVNWTGSKGEEEVRHDLLNLKEQSPKRKIGNQVLYQLPSRLWERLIRMADFTPETAWGEASLKKINRLVELLVRSPFQIKGKTTFKEEFVTCGGVDWNEINLDTMESKRCPGIYFAGEVINVDGETGGFNFQAAWTTAWVAARAIVAY